jgi:hypothetical protein
MAELSKGQDKQEPTERSAGLFIQASLYRHGFAEQVEQAKHSA